MKKWPSRGRREERQHFLKHSAAELTTVWKVSAGSSYSHKHTLLSYCLHNKNNWKQKSFFTAETATESADDQRSKIERSRVPNTFSAETISVFFHAWNIWQMHFRNESFLHHDPSEISHFYTANDAIEIVQYKNKGYAFISGVIVIHVKCTYYYNSNYLCIITYN